MKLAPILGVLLLLTLGCLVVVVATDAETAWFADDDGNPIARADAPGTQLQAGIGERAGASCLDEAELRRVIREELAATTATNLAARHPEGPGAAVQSPAGTDAARQLDLVNRQLDEYIRAGAISESEMAALQREIARLDQAEQRAAIGRIVRAINSGALAGHL